jgi:hypothetical protein
MAISTPVNCIEGSQIANCLELTNGTYNIGCPGLGVGQNAECLLEGPNGTSPYARLCDNVTDCQEFFPIDEGNRGQINFLLDCKIL